MGLTQTSIMGFQLMPRVFLKARGSAFIKCPQAEGLFASAARPSARDTCGRAHCRAGSGLGAEAQVNRTGPTLPSWGQSPPGVTRGLKVIKDQKSAEYI